MHFTFQSPRIYGSDGRILLKWIFKKWDGGSMHWIDLAQNMDWWRAFVNAVMKLRGA